MKKLLPFILILGFIIPIQPANAITCPTAKKIQKEMENKGFDMKTAEGVTRTLAYYKLILTNKKILRDMSFAARKSAEIFTWERFRKAIAINIL